MRRADLAAWVALLTCAFATGCSARERPAQLEAIGGPGFDLPEAGPPDPGATRLESETHLAVGPGGSVVAAWIGYDATAPTLIGYRVSRDDGVSFGAVQGIVSPEFRQSSDPVLAASASGDVLLTWIGFRRTGDGAVDDGHVYVARLAPGAEALGDPVEVTDAAQAPFFDKPWIATSRSGAALVTYAWFTDAATGIAVARSVDGTTWTRTTLAEDAAFAGNLPHVCAAPDGPRVWVVWWDASGRILARWSDDEGASFPPANAVVVSGEGEQVAFADPSCVARGTSAVVAYGVSPEPFVTRSNPLLTEIPVVRVDTAGVVERSVAHDAAAGARFLLPQLAQDETGGVYVTFYSGAGDEDAAGRFVLRRSEAGALTFGAVEVIGGPVLFSGARDRPIWLGDYTGLAVARGRLHASYVTNGSGVAHVAIESRALAP